MTIFQKLKRFLPEKDSWAKFRKMLWKGMKDAGNCTFGFFCLGFTNAWHSYDLDDKNSDQE